MIPEIQRTIAEAGRVGTKPTLKFFPISLHTPIIAQILKDLEEEVTHGQHRMA